jgi:hypothetical protein
LALAITGTAFAGDYVTVESQNIKTINGAAQHAYVLGVKHDFNTTFAGDVAFTNAQTNSTNALSTRLETGVTGTLPLFGSVKGYTRVSLGQKYSNTASSTFYTIEPGVSSPIGPFTAKVGVRYRSATDPSLYNDQTHTVRTTLGYPLTPKDNVYVRYDRIRGDSQQNSVIVGLTHAF